MIGRVACVLLGVWAGALGVVLHRQRDQLLGIEVPWGAVAALALVLTTGAAAGLWVSLGAAWTGAGWVLALLATQPGPDVWVAGDLAGWAFALGGLAGYVIVSWWTGDRTSGSTP